MINRGLMHQLGKEAAYRRALIEPPKATVNRSRRIKVKSPQDTEVQTTIKAAVGNAQPPYRYGQKLK